MVRVTIVLVIKNLTFIEYLLSTGTLLHYFFALSYLTLTANVQEVDVIVIDKEIKTRRVE